MLARSLLFHTLIRNGYLETVGRSCSVLVQTILGRVEVRNSFADDDNDDEAELSTAIVLAVVSAAAFARVPEAAAESDVAGGAVSLVV